MYGSYSNPWLIAKKKKKKKTIALNSTSNKKKPEKAFQKLVLKTHRND